MSKTLLLLALLAGVITAQQIVWTRTFLDSSATGPKVAVDTRGNVIVAAPPWLRKYGPDGDSLLWLKQVCLHLHTRVRVATDREDNILLGIHGGYQDTTWTVTKLSPTGDSIWTWRTTWSSPPYPPSLTAIATDSENRVLVTGYLHATYSSMWFTFRLGAGGAPDWMRTFASGWGPDRAVAVSADPSDNVLVGGSRGIEGRNRQWFPLFVKYSPDGESLAAAVYVPDPDSSPAACLVAWSIAADPADNILLAGDGTIYSYTSPEGNWYGTFLFKHDPDGTARWRWFSEENNVVGLSGWTGDGGAVSCRTDAAGNVLLVRAIYLPHGSLFLAELREFRPDGEVAWVLRTMRLHLPLHPSVYSPRLSLALCPQGDIVLAGRMLGLSDTAYVQKVTRSPGVSEADPVPDRGRGQPATVRSGAGFRPPTGTFEVYDASGKLVIAPGRNDYPRLPAGIYFVRRQDTGESARLV
ncbi:MAG: T9SS type A sorting domain-containing protein, partial [bacterium]